MTPASPKKKYIVPCWVLPMPMCPACLKTGAMTTSTSIPKKHIMTTTIASISSVVQRAKGVCMGKVAELTYGGPFFRRDWKYRWNMRMVHQTPATMKKDPGRACPKKLPIFLPASGKPAALNRMEHGDVRKQTRECVKVYCCPMWVSPMTTAPTLLHLRKYKTFYLRTTNHKATYLHSVHTREIQNHSKVFIRCFKWNVCKILTINTLPILFIDYIYIQKSKRIGLRSEFSIFQMQLGYMLCPVLTLVPKKAVRKEKYSWII